MSGAIGAAAVIGDGSPLPAGGLVIQFGSLLWLCVLIPDAKCCQLGSLGSQLESRARHAGGWIENVPGNALGINS